jgi:3-phenylpropionate/trans-cinnamate dioxygenase ferredoxin reductase subunit
MRAPELLARKGITLRTGVRVQAIDRGARTVHAGRRQHAALQRPGAGHRRRPRRCRCRVPTRPTCCRCAHAPTPTPLPPPAPLRRAGPAGGGGGRRFHRAGSGGHGAQEGPGRHGGGNGAAPAGPRAGAVLSTGTPSCTAAMASPWNWALAWRASTPQGGLATAVLGSAGQRWPAGPGGGGHRRGRQRRPGARRRAWNASAASWSTPARAPPTRPSWPPATAPRAAGRRHAAAAGIGQQRHRAGQERRRRAAGQPRPFTGTPWFWSDQYDRKLQMAGLSTGADQAGCCAAASRHRVFSVWHYRGGRLLAVDTVNAAARPPAGAQAAGRRPLAGAGAGGRQRLRSWPACWRPDRAPAPPGGGRGSIARPFSIPSSEPRAMKLLPAAVAAIALASATACTAGAGAAGGGAPRRRRHRHRPSAVRPEVGAR